jgi:hypothetical protein
VFDKFCEEQIAICLDKCRDDLRGLTRFVTWDVDGKGGSSSLYKYVITTRETHHVYVIRYDIHVFVDQSI